MMTEGADVEQHVVRESTRSVLQDTRDTIICTKPLSMQPLVFRHIKLGRTDERSTSKLSLAVRGADLEEALTNALVGAGADVRLDAAVAVAA